MTEAQNIEARQQVAEGYLQQALALLKRAQPSPNLLLSNAANAVDLICKAGAIGGDLRNTPQECRETLKASLLELAPEIRAAAEESIPPDDIRSGLGNALSLMFADAEDGFQRDRLNYACILYGQLRIAFHRRDLSERGFPLAAAIAWKQFAETPRLPTDPVH